MDGLNAWVLTLCACAAVVSIAETLLPESAVKKTAYLILSLVTAACLVRPIESLGDLSFDIETPSDTAPYTDWLSKMTQEEFSSNVTALIKDVLREINVTSQNIEVHTAADFIAVQRTIRIRQNIAVTFCGCHIRQVFIPY